VGDHAIVAEFDGGGTGTGGGWRVDRRWIFGAIGLAVVVVVVVVIVSVMGGSDKTTSIDGVATVKKELAGIPQSGDTMGRPGAPIRVVEYGDTSCPFCKDASLDVVPQVVAKYVRTGKVKMTFRPIAFINASSERGALGAEAAARQDAMWPFITLVYRNQAPESQPDWLSDDLMRSAVSQLGLDADKWKSDYESNSVVSDYQRSESEASNDGVRGTPTFIVIGPKGRRVLDDQPGLSDFERAFAEVS
jgi:protein-disulfide isomerase